MLELFIKGGPAMYALLACSILGVYIMIEKFLFLRGNTLDVETTTKSIKKMIHTEGIEGCIQNLQDDGLIIPRMVTNALKLSHLTRSEIKDGLEEISAAEMPKIEKNMPMLHALITIAPLLGLLGTVMGLIKIFRVVGNGDPSLLTGGIAEALIATAAGLGIVIPFVIGYQILSQKIDTFTANAEKITYDVLSFVKDGKSVKK